MDRKQKLQPMQATSLGARHGFFTRAGGVSGGIYAGLNCGFGSGDDAAHVAQNRARVARHLEPSAATVLTLHQVHSATAIPVSADIRRDALPKADAIVTATPGLVIGILTADCAPVLFADAQARVIAAAHAGWRGAVGGVLEATLVQMELLGAKRASIRAAIGPCISQPNYEVGPEFEADVTARDPHFAAFFKCDPQSGRPHFDLPGFIAAQLARAGLAAIERQTPCTYGNESNFYSFRRATHRKEPDYGRQISAIVLD